MTLVLRSVYWELWRSTWFCKFFTKVHFNKNYYKPIIELNVQKLNSKFISRARQEIQTPVETLEKLCVRNQLKNKIQCSDLDFSDDTPFLISLSLHEKIENLSYSFSLPDFLKSYLSRILSQRSVITLTKKVEKAYKITTTFQKLNWEQENMPEY